MDWTNRDWVIEDMLYEPKRKVSNKGSHFHHHLIGEYHSHKMNRNVEYQSLTEFYFLALLELDRSVIRYYVRPIEVPRLDVRSKLFYVPDVLVFRQTKSPCLYDIEAKPKECNQSRYQACEKNAVHNGWEYQVVYPRNIPKVLLRNIEFLFGFTNIRSDVSEYKTELISRVRFHGEISIRALANSFQQKVHPLQVIPLIYHLIATGVFSTTLAEPLNEANLVTITNGNDWIQNYSGWERLTIGV